MRKAIEKFVTTGECQINRKLAVKQWTLLCRIIKHKNEYMLIECSPKAKIKLRIEISKDDAEFLINELNLKFVPHETFKKCGTYLNI